MKVCIVGQGYVGLPLAVNCCSVGYKVFGLDSDISKINNLAIGKSTIEDVSDTSLMQVIGEGLYYPTSDESVLSDVQVVVICVPTPLNDDRQPDLTLLIEATKTVAKNIKLGTLVIVESTVEPGTCRDVLLPIFFNTGEFNTDNFDFVFSPERIDPGNTFWNLATTPKIISGYSNSAMIKARNFYSKFVNQIIVCSSLEVAETAKLLENSFRLVNISLVNELRVFCQKKKIDINEVISAAASKPYGFMPFYPSIGVGGHCIPVDPLYLAKSANAIGTPLRIIQVADEINISIPSYFVDLAVQKIGKLDGKRILIIGVAYKPNVADVRETPVEALISGLESKGAEVSWHDDLVKEWNGEKSISMSSEYDLAILATPHDYLDLSKLGNVPILNTRGSI
jgi:UDP-N-acetyl-D-glucosamine dehydrogenase